MVHASQKPRCVACQNCELSCPFGVPIVLPGLEQMLKCDLCYDRSSVGLKPMCATVCPSQALLFVPKHEVAAMRGSKPLREFQIGALTIRTRNAIMVPDPRSPSTWTPRSSSKETSDGRLEIPVPRGPGRGGAALPAGVRAVPGPGERRLHRRHRLPGPAQETPGRRPRRPRRRPRELRLCRADDVAPGNSFLFTYRDPQDRCILVRTQGTSGAPTARPAPTWVAPCAGTARAWSAPGHNGPLRSARKPNEVPPIIPPRKMNPTETEARPGAMPASCTR